MAKQKTASKRGSRADFQIRQVKTREDRKRPSVFMRLKAEEMFKGYALFEPDPEAKDNPGYFEYYDHYDKQANQYVPCAGEKCPFCAANDNPSTRALTAWYFPEADTKDQVKLFTMNFGTINDITDESDDEGGILGRKVRIKRLDDRGSYKVKVIGKEKPLTKKQLAAAMALLEELIPNGLEGIVMKQLKIQIERLRAVSDLEDDDDDDEDDDATTTTSRKGRAVVDDEEDEDEDETADDDDDEDEDEDEEADEETDDDEEDDDEDEDEDEEADEEEEEEEADEEEEDEEEEEEEDDESATAITGSVYEVVKVNERDETLDLKGDDGKVKMWVGEGLNPNYDEITKGTKVKIDAEQDDEQDWIITAIALADAPKRGRGRPKSGSKTAGSKSGSKRSGSKTGRKSRSTK